jgi:hypothetical protein
MYWIYLIIFISIVLVPDIVRQGFYFLKEEQAEEVLIFMLGMFGFFIFLWAEKQFRNNLLRRLKIQKEAHEISKDLTDTYSYIGEMNRKLDVFKEIFLCLPETSPIQPHEERIIFKQIFEAIALFTKSAIFVIRLVDITNHKTLREIKGNKKIPFIVDNSYLKKNTLVAEAEHYIVFNAPKPIENLTASIIIYKRYGKNPVTDIEFLKVLAAKILCILTYAQIKNGSRQDRFDKII